MKDSYTALLQRWLEPRVLGAVIFVAFTLWLFIEVAEEVMEGETRELDRLILLTMRMPGDPATPLGPLWLQSVARDITALGSVSVLSLCVTIATLFLLLAGQRRTALYVPLATLGGGLASFLLKEAFARPRPDLFPHGDLVVTASFPSGHAMISAVVYLTLGALLARLVRTYVLKIYVMGVALALSGLIGISRVYLGVHWPTDVLAGWAAGAAWALGWWGFAELLKGGNR